MCEAARNERQQLILPERVAVASGPSLLYHLGTCLDALLHEVPEVIHDLGDCLPYRTNLRNLRPAVIANKAVPHWVNVVRQHYLDCPLHGHPNMQPGAALSLLGDHGKPLVDANLVAKIDGCGSWRIYWNIILPNCRTILIYIMVTVFMNTI